MIRLYLLGKKGLECLKGLDPKFLPSISDIVIGQDKNIVEDHAEELKELAERQGIPFYLGKDAPENESVSLQFAIGWRWMIPSEKELVVFHDSLLPKYRGFNPLVSALINGDSEIGATAFIANDEFDKGAIVKQRKLSVDYPVKIKEAIDKIALLYVDMLNELMADFQGPGLLSSEQNESLASYSLWRDEEDYVINWSQSAKEIKRFIDAVGYPYKGAKTKVEGSWVRIYEATVEEDLMIVNRVPGKLLFRQAEKVVIVCGQGLLGVDEFYDNSGEPTTIPNSFRLRFG
ncbi:methionyl-tRNA formyltransferase [Poritiphilus flavus]|uniref:Methionyl-tRNA formyltransferase n=1 Tax=Poritiphilus flavus TaxID=2697053 RepID=A0A6L9EE12_9FLAO|nr:formyltransferase family protein [Poritiphilus flavus]NAS12862.1 methionyl-tRNA formyltransferase [Poritiphilus flavus]